MSEILEREVRKGLECQARGLAQWFIKRQSCGQIQDVERLSGSAEGMKWRLGWCEPGGRKTRGVARAIMRSLYQNR